MKNKYISQVSNQEIEQIIKNSNYELVTDIVDKNGEKVPAIERLDSSILVRAIDSKAKKQIDETFGDLPAKLSGKFLSYMSLVSYHKIIIFRDFSVDVYSENLKEETSSNEQDLFDDYISFMLDKFKNKNYKNALLAHYEKEKKNTNNNTKENTL